MTPGWEGASRGIGRERPRDGTFRSRGRTGARTPISGISATGEPSGTASGRAPARRRFPKGRTTRHRRRRPPRSSRRESRGGSSCPGSGRARRGRAPGERRRRPRGRTGRCFDLPPVGHLGALPRSRAVLRAPRFRGFPRRGGTGYRAIFPQVSMRRSNGFRRRIISQNRRLRPYPAASFVIARPMTRRWIWFVPS